MNKNLLLLGIFATCCMTACANLEMTYHHDNDDLEDSKVVAQNSVAQAQARAEKAALEAEKAAKAARLAAIAAKNADTDSENYISNTQTEIESSELENQKTFRFKSIDAMCKEAAISSSKASAKYRHKYLDFSGIISSINKAPTNNTISVSDQTDRFYKVEIEDQENNSNKVLLADYHKLSKEWWKGDKVRVRGYIEEIEYYSGSCTVKMSNRETRAPSLVIHY